ncbi:MAG: preprotein translocase subunit SecE [Phycisphaerae bacterium]|jgi:preprotein translocase subunit SecE
MSEHRKHDDENDPEEHDEHEKDDVNPSGETTLERPQAPVERRPVAAPPKGDAGGLTALRIHKPGQGSMLRWGSAAAGGIISVAAAMFVSEQLAIFGVTVRTLVPVAVLIVLGVLIFRLVGQSRTVVDFLIATEGEMKKVNWSTRREVFGATRVVIVTVLALGFILFFVDIFFIGFFEAIGVLRIGLLKQLLSGGAEG